MKVAAIVPSAGCGRRLGLKTRKPFVSLGKKPLVVHSLKTLDSCRSVDAIIVAAEKSCVKRLRRLIKKFGIRKVAAVVTGGATRFKSVRNCLARIDASFDIVLIHDSARPFVDRKTVERSIALAKKFGACIVAVPENDTVKLVDDRLFIKKTLDRRMVYRAQTPQAFRREIIERAFRKARGSGITDDASLVEGLGKRVKILEGSCRNMKITTKVDLELAKGLL